ncbi:hypothetical protein BpHYR1_019798 [Brachionus plicatilis]|uniref:EF-hand domain-containing protein n=1 Tax=Brachionus plicatilis TaxID=10195 RepID=A0A3M7T6G4_BRAPC|nr:hypothetical protein BpHYR1_019798 [Brachionus plicatilis]
MSTSGTSAFSISSGPIYQTYGSSSIDNIVDNALRRSYSALNLNQGDNYHTLSQAYLPAQPSRVYSSTNALNLAPTSPQSGSNCKFLPPISLDQYKLNNDPNPEIIRKQPADKIRYKQDVAIRFLEPPQPPKHGDIVVRQLPNRQIAPAPPLIVRQAPSKPADPAPLLLREAPPPLPPRIPETTVLVPGKVLPPPARKVVVERLPPIPPKPQQIFVEKWLPFKQQKRRVVFEPAEADCVLPNPRNLVIQWEAPEVEVRREYKNLGSQLADPQEYVRRYGSELAVTASDSHRELGLPELEGEVEALRLVDLERNGLSEYRAYLSNLGVSFDSAAFASSASPFGLITSADSANLISANEAQSIANDVNAGTERPVSDADLRAYFNSLDTNGDGVISYEELRQATL